jgi:hypothetical protein
MSELQAARRILDDAGEGVRRMIRAFHGSPSPEHFDSFDPRYIGTGEGAQAYGYGHYSAQNKDVADEYRRNLSYRKLRDDFLYQLDERAEPEEVMDVIDSFDPRQQQFLRQLSEEDWLGFDYPSQAITQALGRKSGFAGYDVAEEAQRAREQMGTGYEIEIGYPEESLLDWDANLTEQPESVVRAIRQLGMPTVDESGQVVPGDGGIQWPHSGSDVGRAYGFNNPSDVRGFNIYRAVTHLPGVRIEAPSSESERFKAASAALQSAGVPGLRYLDGSSRRAGEGSRNYVMFPGTEDRIRILRKYGLAPATLGAEGLLNQQPEESMAPVGVPVRQ